MERRPPDHILRMAKELEIEGRRPKGRPQKTWLDCIKENLQTEKNGKMSLEESDPTKLETRFKKKYTVGHVNKSSFFAQCNVSVAWYVNDYVPCAFLAMAE